MADAAPDYDKLREWIIDADMSRDGLIAFCPVVRDETGEVVSVVTGLTLIALEPPHGERCVGVWSQEGEAAADAYFEANKAELRHLFSERPS